MRAAGTSKEREFGGICDLHTVSVDGDRTTRGAAHQPV